VIQSVLQSPAFYVIEASGPAGLSPLSPYQLATRLSYFLTRSTPDRELLAAATSGSLSSPTGIEAEVRRLVSSPKAHGGIDDFFNQWLALDVLDGDQKPIPEYAGARQDMKTETRLFTEALFSDAQPWSNLFLGTSTFVNENLAGFYGLPGVTGPDFRVVQLDGVRRRGMLTQPSFLAIRAHSASSPVLRGRFVRASLLCSDIPPPPPGINISLSETDPNGTTRERYVAHRANPACAACHALMDPIGFGFEHFDAVGRYRDTEEGKPIDATGTLSNFDQPPGDFQFDGVLPLSMKMATSPTVQSCLARQWFEFALLREPIDDLDQCSLARMATVLGGAGSFADLVVQLATSDAFRYARW